MGTQRYISTSFYDDKWIQSLEPTEKFIYLYLLTNPLTNIAGVYKIEDRRISFDTGHTKAVVSNAIKKFEKAGKAYRMDEYIIIPSWPKHQKWETKTRSEPGIRAILVKLPPEFLGFLKHIGYTYPIDTLSIPYVYPANYSDLDLDLDLNSDPDINSCGSSEPQSEKPLSEQKSDKPKKPSIREREPENDYERVEKAYLENWDFLYSQKQVEKSEPAFTYGKTRSLLKRWFAVFSPEQIIQALQNGMENKYVLQKGYSLSFMLTDSVLNQLMNCNSTGQQRHRISTDNVSQEKASGYFREAK